MTDKEFEQLFAAMDDITASDELKASTLSAIFDDAGEAEPEVIAPTVPMFRIVPAENDAPVEDSLGSEGDASVVAENSPRSATSKRTAARKTARRRPGGWRLRVAAVAIVVILGLGGAVAYALPASHVLVTVDDTTFDLGVNIFGATVSATANTEEGKDSIAKADVHNRGLEETLNNLFDVYERDHGGEEPHISYSVEGRFGPSSQALQDEMAHVIDAQVRNWGSSKPAEQPSESTSGVQGERQGDPAQGDQSGQNQPSQSEQPMQDGQPAWQDQPASGGQIGQYEANERSGRSEQQSAEPTQPDSGGQEVQPQTEQQEARAVAEPAQESFSGNAQRQDNQPMQGQANELALPSGGSGDEGQRNGAQPAGTDRR